MPTPFTTERWAEKMLFTLKNAKGGFAARIVNHNFHNPGGDKADAVKVIRPEISVVGTATSTGMAMPTGFQNADSTTYTINLDTPIRYAVGLPWEMQLKTEYDVERGYRLACDDIVVQQRNAAVQAAIDDAAADIPKITGASNSAEPTYVDTTTILSQLTKFRVQLMKTGAIMEYGTYRFVDLETQENTSELAGEAEPLEGEGQQVPGPLDSQAKSALPVLGVPSKIYEMIIEAATKSGELTQEKEFYGHVPVIRGFELVLDEALDQSTDSLEKLVVIAGTRNLVTEAFTKSRAELIPDKDLYRDILRGMIVYGCRVTNPKCGALGYFTTVKSAKG